MRFGAHLVVSLSLSILSVLPAFAAIDEAHLNSRLEELKPYANKGLDIEGLEREAFYEVSGYTIDQRAQFESEHLRRQIQQAVLRGFDIALEETGSPDLAREQILTNMENDLHLIDESLRQDIKQIVIDTLYQSKSMKGTGQLSINLVNSMKERSESNLSMLAAPLINEISIDPASIFPPAQELSFDRRGEKNHLTTTDLVKALTDDQTLSERFVSTANISARSSVSTSAATTFSAQVSAEFLGVSVSAGPTFNFKNTISTHVDVKGEGHYPIFDAQGRFDLVLRDGNGKPKLDRGKTIRRFVMFVCEASSDIESETVVKGGFRVLGVGADASVSQKYTTSISLTSRRVLVPNSLEGREATLNTLATICHKQYMQHRVSNGRTVRQNLETMARNMVSGLTYVNASMECVRDTHCYDWYNNRVIWMHKFNTTPKCIQTKNNPSLMTCQLRGTEGANCTVVRNGKRVSNGYFEYQCDKGFRCVVSHEGGWFQNFNLWDSWKAECRR